MADTQSRLKERLGRITFRAWRRGFREADLVLGPFTDQVGPDLSEAELDAFEALLDEEDREIYAWIIGSEPVPERHRSVLMDRIHAFMRDHVATAVAHGAG